ncbi:MAG: hypothetical protein HKN28_02025 [Alphaproteobacteria bacterium]|nr:hypothetical protein [Alphaproteobacteria bacterium]
MFDLLHNEFGAFQKFEDVTASILEAENADQAQFIDLPKYMKDSAA